MKILVDNGHGAKDITKGKYSPVVDIKDETVINKRFREGQFNRIIAKKIVEQLKSNGYDAELIVPEDADISLVERCKRVNNQCKKLGKNNVIFISIHSNALGYGDEWYNADYWTVWTSKGKTKSDIIATYLWNACKKEMPNMKFGKDTADGDVDYESNFYVLKNTNCPAVLTENFFYTNKDNLKLLTSPEFREKIVKGHVNGIINYIKGLS